MYRTNAQSRAIEERSCATACATSWSAARASTSGARSRTCWRTCAPCAVTHDVAAFERILNVPPGHRRADHGAGPGARDKPRGNVWEALRAAAAGRGPGHAHAHRASAGSSRHQRLRARVGMLALPELLDTGARGVGLPADAHGRVAGGRGPLGQPAGAARGGRALCGPGARGCPRPPAGGDGPGGRPGHIRGGRRCRDAHHHPCREGPRVRRRVHRGSGGGRLPPQRGRWTTRVRCRRSGGWRTSA